MEIVPIPDHPARPGERITEWGVVRHDGLHTTGGSSIRWSAGSRGTSPDLPAKGGGSADRSPVLARGMGPHTGR